MNTVDTSSINFGMLQQVNGSRADARSKGFDTSARQTPVNNSMSKGQLTDDSDKKLSEAGLTKAQQRKRARLLGLERQKTVQKSNTTSEPQSVPHSVHSGTKQAHQKTQSFGNTQNVQDTESVAAEQDEPAKKQYDPSREVAFNYKSYHISEQDQQRCKEEGDFIPVDILAKYKLFELVMFMLD